MSSWMQVISPKNLVESFLLKKIGEMTKHVRRNDFRRNGIRRSGNIICGALEEGITSKE